MLNILGYYEPIRALVRRGVDEGFIQPGTENFVLFVDGPKDHSDHGDFDWGKAALDVLDNWDYDHESFYRFDWSNTPTPRADSPKKGDDDSKLAYT